MRTADLDESSKDVVLGIAQRTRRGWRRTLAGAIAPLVLATQSCAMMPVGGGSTTVMPSYSSGNTQSSALSSSALGGASYASEAAGSTPVVSGPLAEQAQELTRYLERHRLPLVRAQMRRDQYGEREVTLYGFVATPYGRSDAEAKARRLLDDPAVKVVNEIKIRPELLSLNQPRPNGAPWSLGQGAAISGMAPTGLGSLGSLQSYQNQQVASPGSSSSSYSWLDYLLPVLGVGAIIGLGFLGGGMGGFYPGMGYPFFP